MQSVSPFTGMLFFELFYVDTRAGANTVGAMHSQEQRHSIVRLKLCPMFYPAKYVVVIGLETGNPTMRNIMR